MKHKNYNNVLRKSIVTQHPSILNSPNFPDIDFRQSKNSFSKSFINENRENQNISKFTLGENFNDSNGLKIDDLKVQKNPSLRYNSDENFNFTRMSSKEKQIFKQKIDENKDFYKNNIENMGVGFQNIQNNQKSNSQTFIKYPQKNKIDSQQNINNYEEMSIQTFNTENLSFNSENNENESLNFNQKPANDYTKIFIPVIFNCFLFLFLRIKLKILMEEKEDDSEYKQGFLEIGDTIVGLYKIEGMTLKKENHVIYSVIYLSIFLNIF